MAFNEISDEYHNELYGHLEIIDEISKFKQVQPMRDISRYAKMVYIRTKVFA